MSTKDDRPAGNTPSETAAPTSTAGGSEGGLLGRMWKRMFGAGESDPFASRLTQFVGTELPTPAAPAEKRKDSLRQKLVDAQQTVIRISDLFIQYVQTRVIRRYPKDFTVDRLDEHEAYTLDGLFEIVRGSAESRYVRVMYRNRFHLLCRVEASVLSRTMNVATIFIDEPPQREPLVRYLDLERYGSVERVRWDDAFQQVFMQFFDWCEGRDVSA